MRLALFRPLILVSLTLWTAHALPAKQKDSIAPPAEALATQVKNLATGPNIPDTKRGSLIASALRTTLLSAIANESEADKRLDAAIILAGAAAQASPQHREIIIKCAALTPGIKEIPGASQKIRAGAAAYRPKVSKPEATSVRPPRSKPARLAPPLESSATPPSSFNPGSPTGPAVVGATQLAPRRVEKDAIRTTPSGGFTWTLDGSVRYDSNVYLNNNNRKSDTVIAVRPGVLYDSGEKARTRYNLAYTQAFTHSIDGTSPNETLGNGQASATFSGNRTRFTLLGSIEQSNQNNRDVLVNGVREIFRTDVYKAGYRFEAPLTARTSAGIGTDYTVVNYPGGVFRDNRSIDVPFNAYYALSPKYDASAGVSYRRTTSPGSSGGLDMFYYNIGARGEFTPVLNGELSVGYRVQSRSGAPSDGALGFQGNLLWALNPKSQISLSLNRDFRTSSQGQTLINSQFGLNFSHTTTLLWQNGASLAYGRFEYSDAVFSLVPLYKDRVDDYLEAGFFTRYQFNRWLGSSLNFSYRQNQSNEADLEFDGVLVNLLLGVTY